MSVSTLSSQGKANILATIAQGFESNATDRQTFTDNIKAKPVDVYYNETGMPVVTFELFTEKFMSNTYGIVHGGCTATIVDLLTSMALLAERRYWNDDFTKCNYSDAVTQFGVSRNISTQYLKAIPLQTTVLVECTVELNSQRYGYYTCKIMDINRKVVYVLATHDKVKLYAKLA